MGQISQPFPLVAETLAADLKSAQCRFESDWGHCETGLGSAPAVVHLVPFNDVAAVALVDV
jgi:hypothetical protein